MKRAWLSLLLLLFIFSACTKIKIRRAQKQLEGNYDVHCSYYQPAFDTILGYYTESGQYDGAWAISIVDSRHIMLNGIEYERVSDDEPYLYEGPVSYAFPPTLTFYPPDSLVYHDWCCGHFGRTTDCIGKKR